MSSSCGCRLLSRRAEWEGEEDREHLGMELRDRQESLSSAQAAVEGERVVCTHFIHSQTVTGCQQLSDILIQSLVGFTLKKKPPLQGKRDLCISRKLFYSLVSSGSQIELVKRPYKSAGHCDFLLFVSLQLSVLVHSGQMNSQCISGGDFWWLFLYFVQTHSFIQELKVRNWLLFSSVPHES